MPWQVGIRGSSDGNFDVIYRVGRIAYPRLWLKLWRKTGCGLGSVSSGWGCCQRVLLTPLPSRRALMPLLISLGHLVAAQFVPPAGQITADFDIPKPKARSYHNSYGNYPYSESAPSSRERLIDYGW